MRIIGSVLYMYLIAALISFFVAFLIKSIFSLLTIIEKKKSFDLEPNKGISDVTDLQKEAHGPGAEGEIYAAIAVALHLYAKEIHDFENMKMTIQKSVKPYSPWSSKIYGLRQWKR